MRLLFFVLLAACGSKPKTDCTVSFSGNVVDEAEFLKGCGGLTLVTNSEGTPNWQLALNASSKHIAAMNTSIDFTGTPLAGTFSSEGASSWLVQGFQVGSADCGYVAGAAAAPNGSYTLTLTSVALGSTTGIAHGTLTVQAYVHAPPAEDCGAGDTETIAYDF